MNKYARLGKKFDEWVDATGLVVKNTSYYFEIKACCEDAFKEAWDTQQKKIDIAIQALDKIEEVATEDDEISVWDISDIKKKALEKIKNG